MRDASCGGPAAIAQDRRDLAPAISRAFGRLVNDLELSNLRFHDPRHDAASTMTMAGFYNEQ